MENPDGQDCGDWGWVGSVADTQEDWADDILFGTGKLLRGRRAFPGQPLGMKKKSCHHPVLA